MSQVFAHIGAGLAAIWGISHLIPTKNVVAGFGDISEDNRNIIRMEWIVEGISLILIGLFVAVATHIDPSSSVTTAVHTVAIGGLLTLAAVSMLTGSRIDFLPFRLCPFILAASAVLILIGVLI